MRRCSRGDIGVTGKVDTLKKRGSKDLIKVEGTTTVAAEMEVSIPILGETGASLGAQGGGITINKGFG